MNRRFLILAGVAAAAATPVLAHHGWAWAEGEQLELKGTVKAVSMVPPHPMITVTSSGVDWQVDLGNPNQTQRSGFTADTTKAGEAIVAVGNRHLDKSRMHMKAVRIVIDGKNYDMYPERIRSN